MTVLATALDTTSPDYTAHRTAMLAKLDALDAEHAKALMRRRREVHGPAPEAGQAARP